MSFTVDHDMQILWQDLFVLLSQQNLTSTTALFLVEFAEVMYTNSRHLFFWTQRI